MSAIPFTNIDRPVVPARVGALVNRGHVVLPGMSFGLLPTPIRH